MAYVFLSQPCSPPLWCENAGWASAWRSRAGDLCLHSRVAFELSNTRPLPDDNRQHQEKDNGLYDTEYPDIDFIVRYAQQVCTIYQYPHTPIKKAVDKLVPGRGICVKLNLPKLIQMLCGIDSLPSVITAVIKYFLAHGICNFCTHPSHGICQHPFGCLNNA